MKADILKIVAIGMGGIFATCAVAVDTYVFGQTESRQRSGVWQQELGNNTAIFKRENRYGAGFLGEANGFVYHIRAESLENDANAEDTVQLVNSDLEIRSVYRDVDISDSISVKIGKFTENWQIANAFSPFSFMSPDSRATQLSNPLNQDNGVLGVAVRYYAPSGDTVYTLYVNGDQRQENPVNDTGYQSVGIKANTFVSEDTDVTLVAQKYKKGNLGVGAGFRNIATDALALYGSAFVRRGTHRAIHKGVLDGDSSLVSTSNPVGDHRIHDGKTYINAVLGAQYTTQNNFQFWAEYGYDQRGMSNAQWETYKGLVNTHKNLTGARTPLKAPNLLFDSSLLHDRGLRQQYVWLNMQKEVGVYEFSASTRVGVDKSAFWQFGLDHEGFDSASLGAQISVNTGGEGTEYGTYQASNNSFTIFFRKDF